MFPDFKVDNFYANHINQYTFFLSHNHEGKDLLPQKPKTPHKSHILTIFNPPKFKYLFSDHLYGLTQKSPLSVYSAPRTDWCFGSIYTSPISAQILVHRFPHLRPYVKALPLKTPIEIKGRLVTLIPANHCPGAVLFLITSKKDGTILHTGDFRFQPKMIN